MSIFPAGMPSNTRAKRINAVDIVIGVRERKTEMVQEDLTLIGVPVYPVRYQVGGRKWRWTRFPRVVRTPLGVYKVNVAAVAEMVKSSADNAATAQKLIREAESDAVKCALCHGGHSMLVCPRDMCSKCGEFGHWDWLCPQ